MGKAIVASNLDQLGEVLTHAENAWLVRPGNVQELALAIERLAGDRPLREELGARARRLALQKHTWQENARRLMTELGGSHLADVSSIASGRTRSTSARFHRRGFQRGSAPRYDMRRGDLTVNEPSRRKPSALNVVDMPIGGGVKRV